MCKRNPPCGGNLGAFDKESIYEESVANHTKKASHLSTNSQNNLKINHKMNLHKIRGGTIEDLEAKKYRLSIGISLGNKWFTVPHIIELIRWALSYTHENVVVYVGDSIHAINLEVKKKITREKALEIATKIGAELLENVKEEVKTSFSAEDIEKIKYAKWNDLTDDLYKSKTKYLHDLYESNESFRNTIQPIARNTVAKIGQSFSEEEIHHLGTYILEELPHLINRVQIAGIMCDAFVYPYGGEIPQLVEKIQNGKKFPEIKENIMDTEPKVFLEVR